MTVVEAFASICSLAFQLFGLRDETLRLESNSEQNRAKKISETTEAVMRILDLLSSMFVYY